MMDKKTILTALFSVVLASSFTFLIRYLDNKDEGVKIQQDKFNSIILKIGNLEKIHLHDIQNLKDQFLKNEIKKNKLFNIYKLDQQNKINELEKDIRECHLQFEWLESRYRKADKKIIERFRRKNNE
jgi:UDP-N-acetylglucosamine transferase subunit ALG13